MAGVIEVVSQKRRAPILRHSLERSLNQGRSWSNTKESKLLTQDHNSALRFRSDSQRHTLGRGRSVTVCGGYNRAGDPGGWSLPLCAAVVIQREQTPAGVDDFLESLLTDGHS